MIHYIIGDLLTTNCNVICHQVNCQGVMGSGLAKEIRKRWPTVYSNYIKKCSIAKLGDIQIVSITEKQSVINMFAQNYYGNDGRRYTSYDAFWNCLHVIKQNVSKENTIAFPYGIGCGLGGANWEIIEKMIEVVLKDYDVFIYKLKGE